MKKLLILLLSICCFSCVDQLEFEIDSRNDILIVDGRISNGEIASVRLAKSAAFSGTFDGGIEQAEGGAELFLRTAGGKEIPLLEQGIGTYEGGTGQIGETYTLFITTADGKKYQSSPQKINQPILIEEMAALPYEAQVISPNTNLTQDRDAFQLGSTFTFPAEDAYIRWRWIYSLTVGSRSRTFRDVNYVEVEASTDYASKFQENFPVYNIVCPNALTCAGYEYSFRVWQYRINKDIHDFWALAEAQRSIDGSIFDAAPAKIIGNIKSLDNPNETVLGIFSGVGIDETDIKFIFN